jgi:PAS domain S-box-containing protein
VQAAFDALPAPAVIIDKQGLIIAVNAAWNQAVVDNGDWDGGDDLGAEYLVACNHANGPGSEVATTVNAGIHAVLERTTSLFSCAYTFRTALDERRLRVVAMPLDRPEGGALVIHHDDPRDAPSPLASQQRRALLAEMADSAPALMWVTDLERRLIWLNRPWFDFTGQSADRDPILVWADGVHADDLGRCREQFDLAFAEQRGFVREYRLRRHDGEFRWFRDFGKPFFTADQVFSGYVGSCLDIHDLKHADDELREHRDLLDRQLRFATALNQLARMANDHDDAAQVLAALGPLFGTVLQADRCLVFDVVTTRRQMVKAGDWIGPAYVPLAPVEQAYAIDLFPESLRHLWETRRPLESHHDQVNPRFASEGSAAFFHSQMGLRSLLWFPFSFRPDGFLLLCLTHAHARHVWREDELAFLGSATNQVCLALQKLRIQSERQVTQDHLHHAQKMELLGHLAGGLAHDVGNLLTTIAGHAEMLRANLPADDPRHPHAEAIVKALDGAWTSTHQLLAFDRRRESRPQVLDPNRLIEDLLKILRRVMGEGIELVTRLSLAMGRVHVDASQLELALLNLAVNARDAMPGGGHLSITSEAVTIADVEARARGLPEGDYIRIQIADTGPGLDQDALAHVFDPFYTTKSSGQGASLGLPGAFGIITAMGGTIGVESTPGKGSTFTVLLPQVAEPGGGRSPTPLRLPVLNGNETVLLVEDDTAVRELVRDALRHHGYTVLVAADGAEALALAKQTDLAIHLLFSDLALPRLDGVALATQLTKLRPDLCVVFTSGHTADAFGANHEFPDARFLAKPFTIDELSRVVRNALGVT